jgi:coniferyl-aldehyde dehydrogenase
VDYLFLPEAKVDAFVTLARQIVPARYPRLDSPDFTAVIDERAFRRITGALAEAEARGATLVQLVPGQRWDEATHKIAPHLVLNAPEDCELLTREIFAPVLPVRGYRSLDEVIAYVNARPRPLALYPFSNDASRVQLLLERVMSGGVSVNDALFHVAQHDLPFGGVGASGMGHYHGYEGFLTFSKLRPVFYQASFSAMKFLAPPYGRFANTLLNFLTR